MGVEDQQEEREVLESIFPDEITGTRTTPPPPPTIYLCNADVSETEFRVSILLDVTPGEEDPEDLEGRTQPPPTLQTRGSKVTNTN